LRSWLRRSRARHSSNRVKQAAVVLLALSVATGAAAATPPRVSAEAFAQRISDAERLAETGITSPSPEAMNAVRRALGLPITVVFPEGDTVVVGLDDFLRALTGRHASHFALASRHLGAMRMAFVLARTTSPPDRAAVRATLARAYAGVSAHPGLLTRIRRAIAYALQSFVDRLLSNTGLGTFVAWAIVAVLLVAGVWGLTRLTVPERRVRKRSTVEMENVDWRRIAEEALARGDHPEAVRARYRLLLQALASQGILRDSPSLTAGECRRSVRRSDRPGLAPPVDEATTVFERVAYGEQPLRPGDLDAMQRAEEEVMSR
jgi:uncharacterized protein DUF4129